MATHGSGVVDQMQSQLRQVDDPDTTAGRQRAQQQQLFVNRSRQACHQL
jgi:hypothetical protein